MISISTPSPRVITFHTFIFGVQITSCKPSLSVVWSKIIMSHVKTVIQEIYPFFLHFIKSNFFLLFHQFIIFFDIMIWPSFYITIQPLTFFQVFQFSENVFNLDPIDWKPYFSIFSIWAVWLVAMRMNKNAGKLQNKNWNDQNRGIVIGLNSLKHNILHPGSWVLHSKFPSSLNNYISCLSVSF